MVVAMHHSIVPVRDRSVSSNQQYLSGLMGHVINRRGAILRIEMYDRILVPTDGSDTTTATIDHALHIAADNDATIEALYVVDMRIVRASSDLAEDIESRLREEGDRAVQAVADRAEEAGVTVETTVRAGTPDKEILEHADQTPTDLIVIGTHGKSPREKLRTMGSVSERVVQNSPVPVLVIRTTAAADGS